MKKFLKIYYKIIMGWRFLGYAGFLWLMGMASESAHSWWLLYLICCGMMAVLSLVAALTVRFPKVHRAFFGYDRK